MASFDTLIFNSTLNSLNFFPPTALAPSSTFAPSVSVASPAKLQAAAALAEVANGIEGEVSYCNTNETISSTGTRGKNGEY